MVKTQELVSYDQTAYEIFRLARQYVSDIVPLNEMVLDEIYTYVKNLPYIPDPVN